MKPAVYSLGIVCISGFMFAEGSKAPSFFPARAPESTESALSQYDPKTLETAEKQKIIDAFLNKLVVAKISMPMTTQGITISWATKTSEWLLYTNDGDLRRWGVGVRASEKYSITKVVFESDRVELWLNDGGAISESDKLLDSTNGSQSASNQMKHNQQMATKKGSADGSRIKIFVKGLPRSQPLLDAIREQVAQVISFADSGSTVDSKTPVQGSPDTGLLLLTSEPTGADVFIDDAFVGQTPVRLPLKPGVHKIRITVPSQQEWAREIQVISGAEVNLKATLQTGIPK